MDKEELKQNYASIHTLRMEGDPVGHQLRLPTDISIHTLRMEGDGDLVQQGHQRAISIHTLRMEGDGFYGIS